MTRIGLAGLLLVVGCGGGAGDGDGGNATDDAATGAADATGEGGRDAGPDAGVDCSRELFPAVESGGARAIAVDDARVYAVTGVTGEVHIWDIDPIEGGGELLATLPLGGAERLVFDDDSLYIAGNYSGYEGLFRVAKDGGGEPERVSADPVTRLALDETHVYWMADGPLSGDEQAIKRRAKAGGEEELLVEGEAEIGGDAEMAVLGDHVYWNDDIHLRRKPKAGGTAEVFDYLGPEGARGSCEFCLDEMVAADDGRLYWYDRADRTFFYRTGTAAFERELLSADSSSAVSNDRPIFVLDGQIYWSSWSARYEIGRAPTAGGETTAISTGEYVHVFYPTPAGIYVASLAGQVRLVPLDGCPE